MKQTSEIGLGMCDCRDQLLSIRPDEGQTERRTICPSCTPDVLHGFEMERYVPAQEEEERMSAE
jgi:hypothetical protein